jgi:hypothetical protein
MLKIKDNVDLKELEKFGFDMYSYPFYKSYEFNNMDIIIISDNLYITMCSYTEMALDALYDLIKADLVEKIEQ